MSRRHEGERPLSLVANEGSKVIELDEARHARRKELLRRIYDLEEAEGRIRGRFSEEAQAMPEVAAFRNDVVDLLHAWDDLVRQTASINSQEWLEYRREREGGEE